MTARSVTASSRFAELMRHAHRRPLALVRSAVSLILLTALLVVLAPAPNAVAHAELRQASPRVDSVVGGVFHSVQLQFSFLSDGPFRAELLDPAGQPIGKPAVREDQRIVIPIDPLQVPGTYTVSYTVTGADGDLTSDLFSFRYEPDAAEPEPITIDVGGVDSWGWFDWALLIAAAAVLGYLVHRITWAWRGHRAAQATESSPA